MTPEKAIEILGTYRDEGEADLAKDLDNALTLGIEALKQIKDFRLTVNGKPFYLLPGEE